MARSKDPQKATLSALLEPYRNRRTALVRAMGDDGKRMLADYCDSSPTAMAEFLGMRQSTCSAWLQKLGIKAQRRDPYTTEDDMTLDAWEQVLLRETQAPEQAIEYTWRVPKGIEYVRLHFVGDVHFGNRHQDTARLREFIAWLQQPEQANDRWILLGDLFEMRTRGSKGEAEVVPHNIAYQIACKWFAPIMRQCILCHTGNHDRRVARDTDIDYDPVREFAKQFSVPYHGMDGFHRITLQAGKAAAQTYTGYCHHGYGGARTDGARRNQLVQMLLRTNADYLAMAHLHSRDAGGAPMFGLGDDGQVEEWSRPVVRCGSFVAHRQGSYARNAGIPPGTKGAGTLHMYTTRHSAHARS